MVSDTKSDKDVISFDSLCNSGDPNTPQDPFDGIVRFCKSIANYFSCYNGFKFK